MSKDERVELGQIIGESGATGIGTGSHLHFQIGKKPIEFQTGDVANASREVDSEFVPLFFSAASNNDVGILSEGEFYTGDNFGSSGIVLYGSRSANLIEGSKGSDRLFGGAGRDTAIFQGRRSEYLINTSGEDGTVLIEDLSTLAVDELTGIELLRFEDEVVDLLPVNARGEVILGTESIGEVGDTGVFRVDLSAVGLEGIGRVTIVDDDYLSGGTGAASGFDLDFVKLSTTYIDDAIAINTVSDVIGFAFDEKRVTLVEGVRQPWERGQPEYWRSSELFGTSGINVIDFDSANLGVLDGVNAVGKGGMALGEGGQASFTFSSLVDTDGLYLYIGDIGGGNDDIEVLVSSSNEPRIVEGLDIVGGDVDDTILLGVGDNASVGIGDDRIIGAGGDDTITGFTGDDLLGGGPGADTLSGDAGDDSLDGGDNDDVLIGGNDADHIVADDGADQVLGGHGNDRIGGGAGNDGMAGGDDDDVIDGSDFGNDAMDGEAGTDHLALGKGADTATGGMEGDLFFLRAGGAGIDRITDFMPGIDKLVEQSGRGVAALIAGVAEIDAGTVLKLGEDDFVIVQGARGIDASWFL